MTNYEEFATKYGIREHESPKWFEDFGNELEAGNFADRDAFVAIGVFLRYLSVKIEETNSRIKYLEWELRDLSAKVKDLL